MDQIILDTVIMLDRNEIEKCQLVSHRWKTIIDQEKTKNKPQIPHRVLAKSIGEHGQLWVAYRDESRDPNDQIVESIYAGNPVNALSYSYGKILPRFTIQALNQHSFGILLDVFNLNGKLEIERMALGNSYPFTRQHESLENRARWVVKAVECALVKNVVVANAFRPYFQESINILRNRPDYQDLIVTFEVLDQTVDRRPRSKCGIFLFKNISKVNLM